MKKGQVTIFIVLGLMIVVAVAVYLLYSGIPSQISSGGKDISTLSPQFASAGKEIEDCLGIVLDDAAASIGLKGGYMDSTGLKTYDYAGLDVTYLYYDGQSYVPNNDAIAKALGSYVKQNGQKCADISGDIEITAEAIKDVKVYVKDTVIDADVEWPLTFKKGDFMSQADIVKASAPVRLGKIMNEVTGFMAVQVQKPGEICLSCLLDSAEKNNFEVEIDNMITTYVFSIKDKEGFEFVFANGY